MTEGELGKVKEVRGDDIGEIRGDWRKLKTMRGNKVREVGKVRVGEFGEVRVREVGEVREMREEESIGRELAEVRGPSEGYGKRGEIWEGKKSMRSEGNLREGSRESTVN